MSRVFFLQWTPPDSLKPMPEEEVLRTHLICEIFHFVVPKYFFADPPNSLKLMPAEEVLRTQICGFVT